MRLGDLDTLRKAIEEQRKPKVYSEADERQNVIIDCILYIIDNAPTIIWCDKTPDGLPLMDLRPQGECKSCRHRDPEDKKCDCGGQERQGCPFPVSDDYYCKYYERGDAE